MTSFEEQTVRRIGRYEVIRKIATGGMAELFLARFVGPGGFEKRCALKRILPQFAADKIFTKMFLTEARVTAMFDHPNLVQIFELGQDEEGQFYIAMELVNGMNLRQLLHMCRERGQLVPPELAAYMMTQALDGLAYAHEFKDESGRVLGLVHRDVSPQNILLSYEGAVKIVDFGIVKGNSISSETQAGMLKGKVAYMSPEQAQGDPIDGRSDLFSVGVCLYELIAGEKPFNGPNEIMCLKAILEKDPEPITMYAPDCPESIERIIYKALAKHREDRFYGARQFQIELQEVLKSCPAPLGRHVIAEYIKSLTEGGTSSFDSTSLRIPRSMPPNAGTLSGVGFAPSHSSISLAQPQMAASNPSYAPAAPRASSSSAPRVSGSSSAPRPAPPFDHGLSPTPVSRAPAMAMEATGLTAEINAAGIGRVNPMIVLVFAASALAGGLAVYLVTRDDNTVVVEVPSEPPERPLIAEMRPPPPKDNPPQITPPVIDTTPAKQDVPPTIEAVAKDPPPKKDRDPPAAKKESAKRKAAEKNAERNANSGTLTLTSNPRGLTVQLDNDTLGKTPLVGVMLPAGTHTLKLVNKGLGISKKINVRIAKGTLTTETFTVGKGTLKVNSRPWSEVFVDGVSKGKTPLETPIYEGSHEVRLVSPEAGERIQKIEIEPGQTEDLRIKF